MTTASQTPKSDAEERPTAGSLAAEAEPFPEVAWRVRRLREELEAAQEHARLAVALLHETLARLRRRRRGLS
jgi:hypothetical protein